MLAAGSGKVDTVHLLLQCGAAQSINTTDAVSIKQKEAEIFINMSYILELLSIFYDFKL